jgi:hypothetical protein
MSNVGVAKMMTLQLLMVVGVVVVLRSYPCSSALC